MPCDANIWLHQVFTVQFVGAEDHSVGFPMCEADQVHSVLLAVQGTERPASEQNSNNITVCVTAVGYKHRAARLLSLLDVI